MFDGAMAGPADANAFDNLEDLLEDWHTDLVNIYTWNTDHSGHPKGLQVLYDYGTKINGYLEEFDEDVIADMGLERNVVYILFDDHGRIEHNPERIYSYKDPEFLDIFIPYQHVHREHIPLPGVATEIMDEFAQPNVAASSLLFGDDGTMLQVYLRDLTKSWRYSPDIAIIRDTVKQILLTPPYNEQIQYVLYTDKNGTDPLCSGVYCGVKNNPDGTFSFAVKLSDLFAGNNFFPEGYPTILETRLNDLAKSGNSGNILIILKSQGTMLHPESNPASPWASE